MCLSLNSPKSKTFLWYSSDIFLWLVITYHMFVLLHRTDNRFSAPFELFGSEDENQFLRKLTLENWGKLSLQTLIFFWVKHVLCVYNFIHLKRKLYKRLIKWGKKTSCKNHFKRQFIRIVYTKLIFSNFYLVVLIHPNKANINKKSAIKDKLFPDWHLNLRFSLVKSRSMTPLKSALYFLLVLRPGGSCQKWLHRAAICPDADQSGSLRAPWSTSECILRTCEAMLRTPAVKEERKSESTREGCLLKTRKWDFRMPTAHHQETGQTSQSICLSFCHGNSLNTLQTRQQNAGTTDTSLDNMLWKVMSFFFHFNGCHTNSFHLPGFTVTRVATGVFLFVWCLLLWQRDAAFMSHSPLPRVCRQWKYFHLLLNCVLLQLARWPPAVGTWRSRPEERRTRPERCHPARACAWTAPWSLNCGWMQEQGQGLGERKEGGDG